jgi:hypothetical protein
VSPLLRMVPGAQHATRLKPASCFCA